MDLGVNVMNEFCTIVIRRNIKSIPRRPTENRVKFRPSGNVMMHPYPLCLLCFYMFGQELCLHSFSSYLALQDT